MGLAQLFYQIPNFNDLDGIKAHGGFIQNDDLRRAQQGLGNTHPLLIALGKRGDPAAAHLFDSGALYGVLNLPLQFFSANSLGFPYKAQVFQRRFILIERRLLRQISDQPFGFFRLFENIITADPHMPFCGRETSGHDVHGGGLTCSVGAEKAVDLTAFYFNAQIGYCQVVSIPLCEMLDFNQVI